jgi:hypothetical protein
MRINPVRREANQRCRVVLQIHNWHDYFLHGYKARPEAEGKGNMLKSR